MNSMTGFGLARREVPGWELRAEVRTVNGRFLSVRLQLAEPLREATPEVEAALKAAFQRGSVHCQVSLIPTAEAAGEPLNLARLEALCRSLQEVRRRLGLSEEVSPEWLLAVPGVAGQMALAEPESEGLSQAALEAVREAVERVSEARRAEGERLREFLRGHVEEMRRLSAALRERAPAAVEACRERLRLRVEELLSGSGLSAEGETLERELAYMAERSDVTEELNRIDSHLKEVALALEAEGPVGRRLEFLAQELGREANTLAAKVPEAEMGTLALGLRQEVDRVRQQVANVE